jgi:hypothetical protein
MNISHFYSNSFNLRLMYLNVEYFERVFGLGCGESFGICGAFLEILSIFGKFGHLGISLEIRSSRYKFRIEIFCHLKSCILIWSSQIELQNSVISDRDAKFGHLGSSFKVWSSRY